MFDDTVESPPTIVLNSSPTVNIPGLFLTNATGQALETALGSGAVDVSLGVTSVPEPSSTGLIAAAMLLGALDRYRVRRRHRRLVR